MTRPTTLEGLRKLRDDPVFGRAALPNPLLEYAIALAEAAEEVVRLIPWEYPGERAALARLGRTVDAPIPGLTTDLEEEKTP